MWIPDMPNLPPQDMPMMIAQANQAQSGDTAKVRTFGVCSPKPNHNYSAENVVIPVTSAGYYLQAYEHRNPPASATTTILQQPKHGVLRLVTEADRGTLFGKTADLLDPNANLYVYLPDSNYVGKDSATVQVDFGGGLKVNVKYFFQAVNRGGLGDDWVGDYCGKTGPYWKISSILDANGNSTLTSFEYQSPAIDTATLAATLGSSVSSLFGTSGVTLNIADLAGGALGQTTGSSITLDTTASGNGWFIDTTPSDNSEYLPTSNPNEWVAKAGSAAAGKMDMLSVLLHEYGHALGIDHSADGHDYMGTTLTAGVRRLPTADEMALMQQLIAQAKSGLIAQQSTTNSDLPSNVPVPFPTLPLGGMGIAFAGLLQRNRYGGLNAVLNNSTMTQYDVAANSTLTNGSLNNGNGWATQGSVTFNPSTFITDPSTGSGRTVASSATLREISTTQTRLSQVFMVNANDRYLSFTLSGTALDNMNGAPDDAFEVALFNANTGASLLGSNGLTHSDAFLNLQADGTEHTSSGVTRITNPDGSRTYRLDLSGVASGTAVNLSFDLIGFGANGSHVNISDVRLSGLPQLHNDTATILEDGTLSFNPYAQVITGNFTSTVVNAPAHGAVTMNADGTFSYTPTLNYNGTDSFTPRLNYFGADSFTYKVNDGSLETWLSALQHSSLHPLSLLAAPNNV
jgi:Bacterial Ig domain/Matrixin